MDEWKSGPDDLSLDCDIKYIADVKEVGRARLYFMPPGKQTNTFSMEATDDGTADEYYGTCHEFYYILGESLPYTGAKTYPAYRRAQQTN